MWLSGRTVVRHVVLYSKLHTVCSPASCISLVQAVEAMVCTVPRLCPKSNVVSLASCAKAIPGRHSRVQLVIAQYTRRSHAPPSTWACACFQCRPQILFYWRHSTRACAGLVGSASDGLFVLQITACPSLGLKIILIFERHLILHALGSFDSWRTSYVHCTVLFATMISHILRRLTGHTSFESEIAKDGQLERWKSVDWCSLLKRV